MIEHFDVLILILLEYDLRLVLNKLQSVGQKVLILILLEYDLRRSLTCSLISTKSLNPYSIGI